MIYIYGKPVQSTQLQAAVANGNQVSSWFLAGHNLTEAPRPAQIQNGKWSHLGCHGQWMVETNAMMERDL